jgi:hypothetical protein
VVYQRLVLVLGALTTAVVIVVGCAGPLRFPSKPLLAEETAAGLVRAYDTDGDGRADYFPVQDASGRVVRIGYDTKGEGTPTEWVALDAIPVAGARHIIFIVDGIGDVVVEAMRKEGRLRLFYPPSRLISTYPAYTDLALTDAFASTRCIAFEAVHYDHVLNQVVGGDLDYLSLANEVWARNCDYRLATLWDPFAYLVPEKVMEYIRKERLYK